MAAACDVLRVKPLLGRGFQPGEDRPGAAPVVLLSHQLWQNRFNGDRHVVGKAVRVNGRQATVVGVMAGSFRFPINEQLWTPLLLDPGKSERGKGEAFAVFGRLRPDVTVDQAAAEMAAITRSLAVELPRTNRGFTSSVEPIMHRFVDKTGRYMLYTMLVSVCCVLLIACINVASLITSRASQRTREIAIRAALGAARRQVIAQILTESLILALVGTGAGLGLAQLALGLALGLPAAFGASRGLADMVFPVQPGDPAVFALVAAGLSLVALLACLIPGQRAMDVDPNVALRCNA